MSTLSSDEINKLSQNLVYQVAYAFYDTPYIILLKLLVQLGVTNEKSLADALGLSPNDMRRYMGTLHVHRLVKRYVNKEKALMSNWQARPVRGEVVDQQGLRVKDVHYWYLDYREFANVVKYRLAMMRKGIDERIKQEAGHRGYICPSCGRIYDPLSISHLFDPSLNTFICESCSTELVEHDPTTDPSLAGSQDRMGRFNLATAPIRDALKAVEGLTLPSVNVVAWIAQNVKVISIGDGDAMGRAEEEGKKFRVVLGGEGDERQRLERERLAEAQRTQNKLPVWHTHSTVTGSATTLGLKRDERDGAGMVNGRRGTNGGRQMDDDELAAHYASLVGEVGAGSVVKLEPAVKQEQGVKLEPEVEEDEGEMEEMSDVGMQDKAVTSADVERSGWKMIMVNGIGKALDEVTEEDQELMTTDEYQKYYEAIAEA